MTKLDKLLVFLYQNPGATRRQIIESGVVGSQSKGQYLLNMYLSMHYGYLEGTPYSGRSRKFNRASNTFGPPRPEYITAADFKPVKGRIIKSYYLTELGKQKLNI